MANNKIDTDDIARGNAALTEANDFGTYADNWYGHLRNVVDTVREQGGTSDDVMQAVRKFVHLTDDDFVTYTYTLVPDEAQSAFSAPYLHADVYADGVKIGTAVNPYYAAMVAETHADHCGKPYTGITRQQ